MKKALVFVLTLVMVMAMAVPAFAATSSPAATEEDLKPALVSTSAEVTLVSAEEIEEMSEEVQATFAEAKEKLEDVVPEGMAVRYFFYFVTEEACDVEFDFDGTTDVVIMQYVDGEWVELEYTVNADGTVTVLNMNDAPVVILFK